MRCWERGRARIGRARQKPYGTQRGRTGDCLVAPNRWGEPRVLSPHGHAFFQDRVAFRTERVRSERAC